MKNKIASIRRPVLLIILDGYGVNPSRLNNGVLEAATPNFDRYYSTFSHTVLAASGLSVGLPDGQMGNSEVGHMTLGCGSIIRQDLVKIDQAISDGSFKKNKVLCEAMLTARNSSRPIHLMGLVSTGGVHSHSHHLYELLEMCRRFQVEAVLHIFTDGRDTPPHAFKSYLPELIAKLEKTQARIATVSGRFYAMDRDQRWQRIELAWQAIVKAKGNTATDIDHVLEQADLQGHSDEFIVPTVIGQGEPILPGDSVIFFNFRKDRTRQLTSSLFKQNFSDFDRADFQPVTVTCMTEYDQWYNLPYAFEQERPDTSLAEFISSCGLKQFHCAETEKYAHVTFFFNGGHGDELPGEVRKIVPSPNVKTYDLCPEMRAAEVATETIAAINSAEYAFIVVNFANGDMVGHTAIREAIITAIETLDTQVGRLLDVAVENEFSVIMTADHGNCDEMIDPLTGQAQTQHSVYPVPCLLIDKVAWQLRTGKGLSCVAPTVLQLMGLQKPDSMQDCSLLLRPLR